MRYAKNHKEQARAAILQTAARTLKEKGFDGVGVDGLAGSAEVTSGSLYSLFGSKEAFLEQVIDTQLGVEFADIDDPDVGERRRRLGQVLRMYLSDQHCEDAGHGCVMPALSVDVARASDSVQEAYGRRIEHVVALLTPAMHGSPDEQQERAWALVAAIVGAVTIARALPPGEQSRAVLESTLRYATDSIAEQG
jgi:TetR/AcrR family transcriptional repressor of nem operon